MNFFLPLFSGRSLIWKWMAFRGLLLLFLFRTSFCSLYFLDGWWLCTERNGKRYNTSMTQHSSLESICCWQWVFLTNQWRSVSAIAWIPCVLHSKNGSVERAVDLCRGTVWQKRVDVLYWNDRKKPAGLFKKSQNMIATVIAFLKETRAELSRVQWLTREQTLRYTWLVIFISVLVAVFLGGLDYLFGGIVQNVLR